VAIGTWIHYAVTFDTINDIGTIYRNGNQVASGFCEVTPTRPWNAMGAT
jgi:hypothetical protein